MPPACSGDPSPFLRRGDLISIISTQAAEIAAYFAAALALRCQIVG